MPKLSVIIPVYKTEKYLNRCIESVLNQTFTDFECILVDDGSPDNCGKICDEYAKKDKRIRVIHKENGGLSDARNAGIEASKGEYLSFIDSDDWVHPQMLEILYHGIVNNNVLLSVCAYEEVEQEKKIKNIENPIFQIRNGMDFLTEDNVTAVVAWNKLYHKNLFEDIRYPIGKINEDEFVTYKILYRAGVIAFCAEKLYMYFVNMEGITKSKNTLKSMDMFDAFEQRLDFFNGKNNKVFDETVSLLFCLTEERYNKCVENNCIECKKIVAKKMQKYLKAYKDVNINPDKKERYLWIAYPKRSLALVYLNAIKRKIKKIIGKQ